MKTSFKNSLMFIMITLALIVSALGVTPAFADDETPPATEEPAQSPTPEPVTVTEPIATEAPATVEEPGATETPAATEEPVATEAPDLVEESAVTETPSVATPEEIVGIIEALEQLPADTTIVIHDTSGDVLPLATQEAANAFINGDPMWCPSGKLPGDSGCTAARASLTDLITVLQTRTDGTHFDYSGAGTIYIAWDYSASNPAATTPDAGRSIIFYNPQLGLTDLIVQGGWDFANNVLTANPSTISGVNGLYFADWGAASLPVSSLTLNNLIIDGGVLSITNFGGSVNANVELNNVSVVSGGGAVLEVDNGDITVDGSTFSTNQTSGLLATARNGSVTLNNVVANGNNGYGAVIVAYGHDANVTNSTFNSNAFEGLIPYAGLNLKLDKVTANQNASSGARLETDGSATVRCSQFNSNNAYGINVNYVRGGSLTFDGVSFDGLNGLGDYYFEGSPIINNIDCNPVTPTVTVTPPTQTATPPTQTATPPTETATPPTQTVAPPTETPAPHMNGVRFVSQQEPSNDENAPLYFVVAQTEDQLPHTVGEGKAFGSAFQVVLTEEGKRASNLEIMLSFPLTDSMKNATLAVMFWNGSQWIKMSGGSVIGDYFVITVAHPGTYVLVSE